MPVRRVCYGAFDRTNSVVLPFLAELTRLACVVLRTVQFFAWTGWFPFLFYRCAGQSSSQCRLLTRPSHAACQHHLRLRDTLRLTPALDSTSLVRLGNPARLARPPPLCARLPPDGHPPPLPHLPLHDLPLSPLAPPSLGSNRPLKPQPARVLGRWACLVCSGHGRDVLCEGNEGRNGGCGAGGRAVGYQLLGASKRASSLCAVFVVFIQRLTETRRLVCTGPLRARHGMHPRIGRLASSLSFVLHRLYSSALVSNSGLSSRAAASTRPPSVPRHDPPPSFLPRPALFLPSPHSLFSLSPLSPARLAHAPPLSPDRRPPTSPQATSRRHDPRPAQPLDRRPSILRRARLGSHLPSHGSLAFF